MASDDSRGVVRKMNEALTEQPEVSLPKRLCSSSPAHHVGRAEIRSVTFQHRSRQGHRLSRPAM
eukprot:15483862-Alexandrium_andersonii.AAC.1